MPGMNWHDWLILLLLAFNLGMLLWLAARRQILSPKGRRTFANDMLARWGIDE